MADLLRGLFGGNTPVPSAVSSADADFADFATAPAPTPASLSETASAPPTIQTFGPGVPFSQRPYTKWYRVNERVSRADFIVEAFIIPIVLTLVVFHVWGSAKNRRKAKKWMTAIAPVFQSEYAVVGFGGGQAQPSADDVASQGLAKALSSEQLSVPEQLYKEKTADLFLSYATGRQNVAFVDIKLNLLKRYSPVMLFSDYALSFFFDSMPAPTEKVEFTAYAFDGREGDLIPRLGGEKLEKKGRDSTYDGFIWAIVHKDKMKRLRDERYDLSLTITKDNAKLPAWASVMSESAEITDVLLTPALAQAVEACGDDFESLIVTDMPEDAPKTLDDLVSKKRLQLNVLLGNEAATKAVLSAFLRLPDQLVSGAHFRSEVLRRVKATRDEEIKKIRKLDELEKAEGRKEAADKAKKEEREKKLKGMSADEQRKFLDKERDKDQRKAMGRRTIKA